MRGNWYLPADTEAYSLSAVTTGTGTAKAMNHCRQVGWATEYSGTVSGGTILIEQSDQSGYSGTWNQLATIDAANLSAGTDGFGTYPGPMNFIRARITSDITGGGTVSVRFNGELN